MHEVITEWTTAAGTGSLSVMYFQEGNSLTSIRSALATMWGAMDNNLAPPTAWRIRTEGRTLDEATGTLTGVWSEPTVQQGSGNAIGEPVADATQVLIRWRTNLIRNGRFVQGHTFVPGLTVGSVDNGNLSTGAQTAFTTAAQTFASALTGFCIWGRPVNGAGGVVGTVDTGAAWSELAVLRRRRG